MAGTKEATTMSVREMREHLGIKKTESYWLINKRYFDTADALSQGDRRGTRCTAENGILWDQGYR